MSSFLKNHILHPCYQITREHSTLHERLRQLVLKFEIPLIIDSYRKLLGKRLRLILPRHSLMESNAYNIFMSDIDLTIIVEQEGDVAEALEAFHTLKKYYLNLGEPEIVTWGEWNQALSFHTPAFEKVWSALFNIRKLSWQLKKLPNAQGEYEQAKIKRGILNSLRKLGSQNQVLQLDKFFQDCPLATAFCYLELPHYSHYLERWVEVGSPTHQYTIVCSSLEQAQGFIQLIPGHETVDPAINTHPLRKYLLAREINLSLAQLRIQKQNEHIERWIERLKGELAVSLSPA